MVGQGGPAGKALVGWPISPAIIREAQAARLSREDFRLPRCVLHSQRRKQLNPVMNLFCSMEVTAQASPAGLAVIPLLVGPLQLLLALLPAIFLMLGSAVLALFRPSTFRLGLRLLWRMKYALLLLVALIFGAIKLAVALWPAPRGPRAAQALPGEDYPMFRGGPQRLGFARGSAEPIEGGLNWVFNRDNIAVYSTPTVADKRVYFSTADRGFMFNRGTVYCLDADTGAVLWKTTPPGMRAAVSAPVVSGKYLVVGEGFHQTQDACIFCLDLTQRGRVVWRVRTRNHVETTACITNGRVYVGAGDDGYYCVELEPDAAGQPRVVWHAPGSQFPDAETCPVVHDGKVVVGLGVDGNAVVCLDADTGRQIWRTSTPYPVFSPPAIYSNRVFTATGNGDYGTTGEQWAMRAVMRVRRRGGGPAEVAEAWRRNGPAGEVWCLDVANGEVAWRFRAGDQIMGTVAADNGRLYFGSRDGFAYCLSMDGREIARWHAHEPILACPSVGPRTAYFVTKAGRLIALDRETFSPVWEAALGSDDCMGSPTVANGRVYVGTPDSGLLCLGHPGDDSRRSFWPGFLAGPGNPGSIGGATPAVEAAVSWTSRGSSATSSVLAVSAPAASLDQRIFLPVARGPRRGLICWTTGGAGDASLAEQWSVALSNGVSLSPAAAARDVFLVDGSPGDAGRQLHCLDAANGRVRWQRPVSAGASGEFVLARDRLVIQDAPSALASFDPAGTPQWRCRPGRLVGPPAWRGQLLFVTTTDPLAMLALDAPTGRTLWSVQGEFVTGPVTRGDEVLAGTRTGVVALRWLDGATNWVNNAGAPNAPLAVNERWVVTLDRAGRLRVLDHRGTLRELFSGAASDLAPVLWRDVVLFAREDALMRIELSRPRLGRCVDLQQWGRPTTPPVVVGSALFLSTDRAGLLRAEPLR